MPLVSGAVECRSYGADDVEGTSFSFLRVGPGTVCEGGVPPPAVWAWGWVCIALWPIGVPATFATILVSCRHAIVAHQPFRVPLAVASRFLYREYRAHLYLWEVWELLRRLALTGFVLLVPEKHELMRLLAALVISLLSLTALLLLRPYKAADNQAVAVGTQLSATLFFIGATYLKLWADLAAGPLGEAYAAEVLGVDAVDWLAVVLLTLNFAVVAAVVAGAAWQASLLRGSLVTVRLVATDQPPELPRTSGWHVFVSHCWATGQDAAHTIVRQLQLLLPSIKVWLDVDCLDDVGKLESSVRESATFLVYLSRGYFGSGFCRCCARFSRP